MATELLGAISGIGGAGPAMGKVRALELTPPGGVGGANAASPRLEVQFREALAQAGNVGAPTASSPAMRTMFNTLDKVNGQAKSVSEYAAEAEISGGQLTPGEIVQLTMRCSEFTFQCQLTSNIANRSSDGVQQLFRQQG
jgi:hypothetical protein